MKAVIVKVPGTDLYQVCKNGIALTRPLSKTDACIALELWPDSYAESNQCNDIGATE